MTTQEYYEAGNAELDVAVADEYQSSSTNHATLACAYYLRALVEVLCARPQSPQTKEKGNRT